jgi:hypothetical protein
MSDKPYYGEETPTIRLRTWVFGQMVWGAFLAGIVVVGAGVTIAAIYAVGLLLPDEARQTPDPMPRSSLEQPLAAPGNALV